MTDCEYFSGALALWLTKASDIELIRDDIERAIAKADVSDDEYLQLLDLHEVTKLAEAGWSRADLLLAQVTARHVRSRP